MIIYPKKPGLAQPKPPLTIPETTYLSLLFIVATTYKPPPIKINSNVNSHEFA